MSTLPLSDPATADAEVAEVVAHVPANAFANYFAKAAGVDIDFPLVSSRAGAA